MLRTLLALETSALLRQLEHWADRPGQPPQPAAPHIAADPHETLPFLLALRRTI